MSPNTSRAVRGFSLVELMVALVAGLIVSTAVIAFTMSSMKSNGEYIQSTRLTQELRNTMDLVTRDLRRSGYDQYALKYLATGNASPFSRMKMDNSVTSGGKTYYQCVINSYDPGNAGTPGTRDLANGEIRAIRWKSETVDSQSIGVIEFAESSASVTPTCDGDSPDFSQYPPACSSDGWCALSDPKVLDITQFYMLPTRDTSSGVEVRQVDVSMKGRISGTTDTVREVQSTVKVRTDCYDATLTNCDKTPDPNS